MYSEDDLRSAAEAGIFTEETAAAFRAHVARSHASAGADEEYFRLITGFNDIFVLIACALLLVSIAWIGNTLFGGLGLVAMAATAWGLAEFFTRQRRMALPSIALMLCFVGGCLGAVLGWTANPIAASAGAALAAALHWARFKVPITVAAGVAAVVGFVLFSLLGIAALQGALLGFVFVAGVSVFSFALSWDARDRLRQTRRSDVAFWLHLLAAPLMVHPVFAGLGLSQGASGLWPAAVVVALYAAITLASLAIDRRALMVSALAYVLYALSALFQQYGVVSLGFAITALALGSGLLLLSAFWHSSRALVVACLPGPLQQRLAPL